MDILHQVQAICAQEAFQRDVVGLLQQLCAIDTSPAQVLARLRENESRVFRLIRSALERMQLSGGSIVWKELSPAIQNHPAFSKPYYAMGSAPPQAKGRRASAPAGDYREVYRGRGNLLFLLDREPSRAGIGTAVNAHIDTVAPYFPPARWGDFVTGRGAADDKGNVAAVIGALQVLAELEKRRAVSLKNNLTAMFVIDEETGGNGSLDLALDRTLKQRYDSILAMECTGGLLHPANRGAVFIQCDGRLSDAAGASRGAPSLLEAYALAILELVDEGEAIRQESDHPLFPHRPVQTCTGILGPFGQHPTAICGKVSLEVDGPETLGLEELRAIVERGVGRYVARFGDKTRVIDPQTGAKKVERHFDLDRQGSGRFLATVYGASGHIGSLPQNDAAITKWAYVVRELVSEKRARGLALTLALQSADSLSRLSFEGAQGFLPTHSMEEIKARTRDAFLRGIRKYLSDGGWPSDAIHCEVSFDKLHNDAFAGDPNSESMRRALRTAADVGLLPPDQPVRGWDVSCDARLFAAEYPAMPVITFGAGRLEHAHSDQERIQITELMQSIYFTSLFLLRETGTVP